MKLAGYQETGKLQMLYLKTVWSDLHLQRSGQASALDWAYINSVLNVLGLGLEPTLQYFFATNPSFEQFEDWILKNGHVSQDMIEYFNTIVSGVASGQEQKIGEEDRALSAQDLAFFDEHGYVILRNAINQADCAETAALIYDFIDATADDPTSWYKPHPKKQGIMIQLFNREVLNRNRLAKKIRTAYEQLWNRKDLVVSMDRVSFNPPETEAYLFQGPNLHWDMSLEKPIEFGLQGLLYLTDTHADQGAFTLVPGFHRKIDSWLEQFPADRPPTIEDLEQPEIKRLAANAGDFIIWHHALPHGSSRNTSDKPRIVQYINYQPIT